TDEEIDEQELEAHYSFMAKIQEVPTTDSGTNTEPLEQVQCDAGYNVFANERHHSKQPESINNTCVVEKVDSNVIHYSPDMCDNDIKTDKNAVECDDERVALANLIANLKLDVNENKKIQKPLKKANTTLAHELTEYKSILAETSKSLGESISVRDSCMAALQTKQTEFEKYKAFNDCTIDYDKLEHKLNEVLGQLAHKDTKNLALIANYVKKLYKPTNNNQRTSSNSRNKNVDTTPRYLNENYIGQFGNQRTMTVVGARETEKLLLCKQAKKCVPLHAEQADWLEDTDEEINE
nr:hypothetical protein [Tanacetum cinerariifolium]